MDILLFHRYPKVLCTPVPSFNLLLIFYSISPSPLAETMESKYLNILLFSNSNLSSFSFTLKVSRTSEVLHFIALLLLHLSLISSSRFPNLDISAFNFSAEFAIWTIFALKLANLHTHSLHSTNLECSISTHSTFSFFATPSM